jgi:hypothetical protein
MFESIGAYSSPYGPNCKYTISFEGPYATCKTTRFKETLQQIILSDSAVRPASFSAGWAPRLTDTLHSSENGWWSEIVSSCGESYCRTRQYPMDFFFSQHRYGEGYTVSGRNLTYDRETEQLLCKPSRAIYTVNTTFAEGIGHVEIKTDAVQALDWVPEFYPTVGSKDPTLAKDALSIPTINLHSIIGSFVTPLAGTVSDVGMLYDRSCAEGKECWHRWGSFWAKHPNDDDRKY